MRLYVSQLNPTIGDFAGNTRKIIASIAEGRKTGADLVLFSELALTGYPPEDLLLMPHFMDAVERSLEEVIKASAGIVVIVGLPRRDFEAGGKFLRNSAAVIENGALLGYQDKALLPTYDVFDELRYFEPSYQFKLWKLCGKNVGITICEDIWQHSQLVKETRYFLDPIEQLKPLCPELLLNLSASPYNLTKLEERLTVCISAANSLHCPLILCNQVGADDSLIFDGHSIYVSPEGVVGEIAKGFVEDALVIDTDQEVVEKEYDINLIADLYNALVLGLKDYFHKSGFAKACLGLSGGIDSAVVACLAVEALGAANVLGVVMPSRYSSQSSRDDASLLAERLGIEIWHKPIEGPFSAYLELFAPTFQGLPCDATEENLQARIRGMIMMAISNKFGYVVLSTGNKSEMALGYATLYGDMCGGLGVISDVSKLQVYALAEWINRDKEIIPQNTITKPPSAELKPNQRDSDSLPPYEIIDTVLEAYVENHASPEQISEAFGYPLELVQDIVQRIHRNEYKRRQSAPCLRVSTKSFGVGRYFPIVQKWVS